MAELRVYSKSELTRMYGVNRKTFSRWLKLIATRLDKIDGTGWRNNKLLTTPYVEAIFSHLGDPIR